MEEKERYIIDRFDGDIFDTKKGYYPSNQTICDTLNQQDKRIKELETIIFEKPSKKRINFDKWKELYLESQQLKQELKDERAELQQLYSHLEVEAFGEDIQEQAVKEIDKIKEENKQLKQQLAEKDKEIKQLKQSQKQLAIAELEKVKGLIANHTQELWTCENDDIDVVLYEEIDNQIKELKGKVETKLTHQYEDE